jgi:uncharacterized membrane protein (DUF106 family)
MAQISSELRRFNGHGEKLSRKKDQAVMALITEPTIKAAAQKVGITTPTLHKWLKLSEFKAAYREARREAVTVAIARLQQAAAEAVEALRAIMNDTSKPASARVSAARSILELAFMGIEIEDLEVRIEELERVMTQKKEVI